MKWSEELQQRVLAALKERGAMAPCERCRNVHFQLVEGFFVQFASQDSSMHSPSTITAIPTVVTCCKQCGAVTQHVLSILGIAIEEEKKTEGAAA